MKAVLFDCDGTIADSCGVICATMRLAFEAHGLPAPEDAATRGIIGLSLDEAIRRLHPVAEPALVATLVDGYRQAFMPGNRCSRKPGSARWLRKACR